MSILKLGGAALWFPGSQNPALWLPMKKTVFRGFLRNGGKYAFWEMYMFATANQKFNA
jgi:hypothetical protein